MKILLTGGSGQVGWHLRRSLAAALSAESRGAIELVVLPARNEPGGTDLAQPDALRNAIHAVQPQLIVNAAAYTAVDRAETEPDAAFAVNATACDVIGNEAEQLGAWVVHYSSDYVYDGSGSRPWTEADTPAPAGVYGASKLAGDNALALQCRRHVVLRTSWVFGAHGGNFLKTILRAAAQRDSLQVVDDQWGAPTPAALIAEVTARVIARLQVPDADELAGIYHLAPQGVTNWHAYARFAVAEAAARGMPLQTTPERVLPIASADYAAKAPRPANSRLDTRKLRDTFGVTLPPWEDGVRGVIAELAAQT